uniref:Uncharacterized protein n=1 Tax=Arundo donax TaxID=35708 RepID=A0A0A8ZMS0_ARUDO
MYTADLLQSISYKGICYSFTASSHQHNRSLAQHQVILNIQ